MFTSRAHAVIWNYLLTFLLFSTNLMNKAIVQPKITNGNMKDSHTHTGPRHLKLWPAWSTSITYKPGACATVHTEWLFFAMYFLNSESHVSGAPAASQPRAWGRLRPHTGFYRLLQPQCRVFNNDVIPELTQQGQLWLRVKTGGSAELFRVYSVRGTKKGTYNLFLYRRLSNNYKFILLYL